MPTHGKGARHGTLSGPLFAYLGHFGSAKVMNQGHNPAKSEKQRRFFGAELVRKRAGKHTRTGLSIHELRKFTKKPKGGY